MKSQYNKLLKQQISKIYGTDFEPDKQMIALLDMVSNAYDLVEKDKKLVQDNTIIGIEELNKIDEELSILQQELEHKNDELNDITHVMVHDFKEPLRSISSYLQIIKYQLHDSLNDKTKEYFSYVLNASKKMHIMLSDLSDLATINEHKSKHKWVILDKVLESALSKLSYSTKDIHYEINAKDLPIVNGHFTHLVIFFQNLLSNSLKFRKKNTKLQINISHDIIDGMNQITFADNGIGVGKSNTNLFEIFKRAHHKEDYDGTGIGLAICRKVIKNHNGKIWIDKRYKTGFKVHFTFPLTYIQ